MNTQTNNISILAGRILAVIGMFFPIIANFIPPSDTRAWCFVLGGVLMVLATIIEKETFFFILQLVVVAGAGMYFVPAPVLVKAAVPIAISLIFMGYCAVSGKFNDRITIVGVIGISVLALGYGVSHPYIYLVGGILLAIYSWISFFRGVKIAILWALLNSFFTVAVISNILRY